MSDIKPMTVYRYHDGGLSPNPWKVTIILYELDLPFEMIPSDRTDAEVRSKAPLVDITPNGRMPAFVDPNTGIRLWESAAIIEYLLEVYDKDSRLSYTQFPQKYEQNCWKHFQMSGQGPYFGHLNWFLFLHPEPLPSAQQRYAAEVRRVLSVIEHHLTRTQRLYLVGDKLCFADLMFIPWNWQVLKLSMSAAFQTEWQDKYPKCWDWNERLFALESARRAERLALDAWNASSPPVEIRSHSAIVDIR